MLPRVIVAATLACLGAFNPASIAQSEAAPRPINQMCPIGKEPIVPGAGTVEYRGKVVGLCCPGCGEAFLAWDEPRKDEFITLAAAGREPGQPEGAAEPKPATGAASPGPTYPYTLPDCPVGGKLGSMGDPVVKVYDNREVRFCCAGCLGEFESNKAKYWGEIDAKIVEQQLMHYPIDTCIVTGEKLGDDAVNHVHNNRLVRLADGEAAAAFKADPAKHLEALDRRIVDAQLASYPMDRCPVGGPLGSMGEPINFIYMNRLVRLCCGGCESSLVSEPGKYLAKLDKAYADRQRAEYAIDACLVSGAPLGSMGEPVELVAGTRLVRLCCGSCIPKLKQDPARYLGKLPPR
ncbi:MAG: hypothetical protein ACF8SC_02585 [Phycisphaerales bacterium JB037]